MERRAQKTPMRLATLLLSFLLVRQGHAEADHAELQQHFVHIPKAAVHVVHAPTPPPMPPLLPPPPMRPPFLPLPSLTECEGAIMSAWFWQEDLTSNFHHLRMSVWIKHWKPWGRMVFAWKGRAQLWHIEGARDMMLGNWMYNNHESLPFAVDKSHPNVIAVQLDQAPGHTRECGHPDGALHMNATVATEEWACLQIEGSLDTGQPLGNLRVLQSPDSGPLHPEVSYNTLREAHTAHRSLSVSAHLLLQHTLSTHRHSTTHTAQGRVTLRV